MQSKVYKFKELEFYAEDGLIHMIHKNPETNEPFEKVETIPEVTARINALAEIENKLFLKYSIVPAERDMYDSALGFLKVCQDVLRDAKEQGDPTKARVQKEYREDAARSEKYTMKPSKHD